MESLFGDMLMFFAEMFDTVRWYKKEPKIASGYTDIEDGYVDVIIMPKGKFDLVVGNNGSQSHVINEEDKEYIWANDDSPLAPGIFIIDPKENKLCRITSKADWGRYGGFICWEFEIVQGSTGEEGRGSASVIKGRF